MIIALVWGLLLVLLIYPLSLGPVTLLTAILEKYGYVDSIATLSLIYRPICLLVEISPVCEQVVLQYYRGWLWIGKQLTLI